MRKLLICILLLSCKKSTEGQEKPTVLAGEVSSCYTIEAGAIRCLDLPLADADPASFIVLGYAYGKDAHNVYSYSEKIEGADAASFEAFRGSAYAKDKAKVYYDGKVIPEAEPQTFTIRSYELAQDRAAVYVRMTRIAQADAGTLFQVDVTRGSGLVFADKKSVFCLIPSDQTNSYALKVLDIDTSSIVELFSKDDTWSSFKAFSNGKQVFFDDCTAAVDADVASFKKIRGLSYEAVFFGDAFGHVYYRGHILSGVNPAAFSALHDAFGKDGKQVFYKDKPIPSADVASFVTTCRSGLPPATYLSSPADLCRGIVGKDKNRIFDPLEKDSW